MILSACLSYWTFGWMDISSIIRLVNFSIGSRRLASCFKTICTVGVTPVLRDKGPRYLFNVESDGKLTMLDFRMCLYALGDVVCKIIHFLMVSSVHRCRIEPKDANCSRRNAAIGLPLFADWRMSGNLSFLYARFSHSIRAFSILSLDSDRFSWETEVKLDFSFLLILSEFWRDPYTVGTLIFW